MKRAFAKMPLALLLMQRAVQAGKKRLNLRLRWKPREQSVLADQLSKGEFSAFTTSRRLDVGLGNLDLSLLEELLEPWQQFEESKEAAKLKSWKHP